MVTDIQWVSYPLRIFIWSTPHGSKNAGESSPYQNPFWIEDVSGFAMLNFVLDKTWIKGFTQKIKIKTWIKGFKI